MKCTCESMKPGVTNPPLASMTLVFASVSFWMLALDPTAAMRAPLTATASAHGCLRSPVHTRALTIASVMAAWGRGMLALTTSAKNAAPAIRIVFLMRQHRSPSPQPECPHDPFADDCRPVTVDC